MKTSREELMALVAEVEREEGAAAYMFGDTMGALIQCGTRHASPEVVPAKEDHTCAP